MTTGTMAATAAVCLCLVREKGKSDGWADQALASDKRQTLERKKGMKKVSRAQKVNRVKKRDIMSNLPPALPMVLEVGRALASAESPKAKTLEYFLCCKVALSTSTKPCLIFRVMERRLDSKSNTN